MEIICRDMGWFMLALLYLENLVGDFQYKMWFSIKVREGMPYPQCFFSTPPLFNFFWSWTKNVSSVRKCKTIA